jgi:putative ABC transport system permease protein
VEQLAATTLDAVETGLPYLAAFIGIWLLFRIHHDFDLTVGGSFTLGAAVCALWMKQGGSPWLALLLAAAAGSLAGLCTALIMRVLNLRLILASIIVNTSLLSINLVVMGLPNLNIVGIPTIVDQAAGAIGVHLGRQLQIIAVILLVSVVVVAAVAGFLLSEVGLAFRASGINSKMARSVGVSPERMMLLALVLSNALCGLSGTLVAQDQGFVDLQMGATLIIFGITSVLLGEVVIVARGPISGLATVIVGTFAYRLIISAAFRVGVPPQYFNALTGLTVVLAIGLNLSVRGAAARRGWSTLLRRGEEPTNAAA